ncbi:hypothetical protein [Paraburkholderia graminis]|uniref:hypothetical protein n=1 Tax=Paraburkholderia graminis TaxID=60548 RepID=UPI0038B8C890
MTDHDLARLAMKHYARYEEWLIDLASFAKDVRETAIAECVAHCLAVEVVLVDDQAGAEGAAKCRRAIEAREKEAQ